jgi:hypothetical protein
MKHRITCFLALTGAAIGVSCSDGGHSSSSAAGGGMSTFGAQTVTQAASAQISFNTTDTAQPVEPSTIRMSDADTSDTSSPDSVN